ncbi:MAG: SH3 domain-containing protein [Anaerolineae bacterium]
MQIIHRWPDGSQARFHRTVSSGSVALFVLIAVTLFGSGCVRPVPQNSLSSEDRVKALRQIAADYARSGDLAQAQAALDRLDVANPAQLLLTLAEADLNAGRPRTEIEPLAHLADALGQRSPRLIAFLEPAETPSPTPVPASATPHRLTATPEPTNTPQPPSATPTVEPPTPTPSPEPQRPRVVAEGDVNLRSGPGRAYPVIGRLQAGRETAILARNANGDWWQVAWDGQGQAWVAGTVVRVWGPIDTVAIAQNIPTPPPTATSRPTAPPTAPPVPSVDYRIIEQRMLTIQENRGCNGMHNIFVQVLDAEGAPVNGAVVKRIWANETAISGSKDCYWNIGVTGQGCASFDLYNSGDNIQVVSDPVLGAVTSETTRKLSSLDSDISVDELIAAGYCTEGRENCEWRKNPGGGLPPQLCNGHYSWIVKFQRTR